MIMRESKAVLKYELKEALQTFFFFCIFRTLASDDLEMKLLPFYMETYIFSFD